MPPQVVLQRLNLPVPLQGDGGISPVRKDGYTAQVAGPAQKRPRVECVTPVTGTVLSQGNDYVVCIIVFSIDGGCGKRFFP